MNISKLLSGIKIFSAHEIFHSLPIASKKEIKLQVVEFSNNRKHRYKVIYDEAVVYKNSLLDNYQKIESDRVKNDEWFFKTQQQKQTVASQEIRKHEKLAEKLYSASKSMSDLLQEAEKSIESVTIQNQQNEKQEALFQQKDLENLLTPFHNIRESETRAANLVEAASRKEQLLILEIKERHRLFFESSGYETPEVRKSREVNRVSHCWNCKQKVDNSIDLECSACGWIVCGECGACGCLYSDAKNKLEEEYKQTYEAYELPKSDSSIINVNGGKQEIYTLLILAKSYKQGGYCIAGREFTLDANGKYVLGKWVRPVTPYLDGKNAISEDISRLNNGKAIDIFDVVKFFSHHKAPESGQPENVIVNEAKVWEWQYSLNYSDILYHIETPISLWLDPRRTTDRRSSSGKVDEVIEQSLYLIKPSQLEIILSFNYDEYTGEYKKEIHSDFIYKEVKYTNLSVTDPKVRRMLKNQYPTEGGNDMRIKMKKGDEYILCISLGPRFGKSQDHWKFVVTIFDFDGELQRTY